MKTSFLFSNSTISVISTIPTIASIITLSALSVAAVPAYSQGGNSVPPAQCMNQCELAGTCEEKGFDEFPDFDASFTEIAGNCQADYLFAVAGSCSDGKKLLHTGNGFTSEIRLYTESGEFEGLITQTDAAVAPCMGQSYWPRYLQCESPTVVTKLCGTGFDVGSQAFENRWHE